LAFVLSSSALLSSPLSGSTARTASGSSTRIVAIKSKRSEMVILELLFKQEFSFCIPVTQTVHHRPPSWLQPSSCPSPNCYCIVRVDRPKSAGGNEAIDVSRVFAECELSV